MTFLGRAILLNLDSLRGTLGKHCVWKPLQKRPLSARQQVLCLRPLPLQTINLPSQQSSTPQATSLCSQNSLEQNKTKSLIKFTPIFNRPAFTLQETMWIVLNLNCWLPIGERHWRVGVQSCGPLSYATRIKLSASWKLRGRVGGGLALKLEEEDTVPFCAPKAFCDVSNLILKEAFGRHMIT